MSSQVRKKFILICLIINMVMVGIGISVACKWVDSVGTEIKTQMTAQYGEEQFHLQLTAQSK